MLVIDVSQSMRATDVAPSRLAAAQEAAKQFADQLTPGINLGLIAYAGTATVLVVADHQPRRHQGRHRQAAAGRPHRDRRGHLHRAAGHRDRRRGHRRRRRTAARAHRADVRRQGDGAVQPGQPEGRLHRRPHRQGPGRADLDGVVRHASTATSRSTTSASPCRSTTRCCKKIAELSGGTPTRASSLEQLKAGLHHAAGADRLRDHQGRRQRRAGCGSARWCWRWRRWPRC